MTDTRIEVDRDSEAFPDYAKAIWDSAVREMFPLRVPQYVVIELNDKQKGRAELDVHQLVRELRESLNQLTKDQIIRLLLGDE